LALGTLAATMTATQMAGSGRSAWFVGVLMLMVYAVFAMTLVPAAAESRLAGPRITRVPEGVSPQAPLRPAPS
jgi:hypothetical protein